MKNTKTKTKTYYIIWTYIGNYSKVTEVEATSPQDAVDKLTGFFSDDFQKKAAVYVFDTSPVFQRVPVK